jgi:hypothetical protein
LSEPKAVVYTVMLKGQIAGRTSDLEAAKFLANALGGTVVVPS